MAKIFSKINYSNKNRVGSWYTVAKQNYLGKGQARIREEKEDMMTVQS